MTLLGFGPWHFARQGRITFAEGNRSQNSNLTPLRENMIVFLDWQEMSIARSILSLLIALSIALFPIAGSTTLRAQSMDMSRAKMSASHGMSNSEDTSADMDCCPHDSMPADEPTNDCGCIAICAATCFGFSVPSASVLLLPPFMLILAPSPASTPVHSETGSPPFRPPRA